MEDKNGTTYICVFKMERKANQNRTVNQKLIHIYKTIKTRTNREQIV